MSAAVENLVVVCGRRVIGRISVEGGEFIFKYDDEWLAAPGSFDLSPRLKRASRTHSGTEIKNFLENLLPEEEVRTEIAERNKVDSKDIVGLLRITGRDSAGALQVYGQREFAELDYDPAKVTSMPITQLAEEIKRAGTGINYISNIGLKPSLSGAQDKIACRYNDATKEVAFPLAGGATTFILKPNKITDEKRKKILEKAAVNELVSLRLAEKVLQNVPATSLYESSDRDLFIIQRYDRTEANGEIQRIHQFDFCQYFGLSSSDKYEVGPLRPKGKFGIKELHRAVQEETEEPLDGERVLDWVVFNYLVHNTDSHLKNISMLATDTGFKLAPFYDITSVGFYQNSGTYLFDNLFAFDVGGMSKMDEICDIQWRKLALHLEMGEDYFLLKIRKMSLEMLKALKDVSIELQEELKLKKNLDGAQMVLRYIANSVDSKACRCLINTELKTKKKNCIQCEKVLPKTSVLGICPACVKNASN